MLTERDLNTQPSEATYQLLMNPNQAMSKAQTDDLQASRLVHQSIDTMSAAMLNAGEGEGPDGPNDDGEEDGEAGEKDQTQSDKDERSIANTRTPVSGDGILGISELIALARESFHPGCQSAYGSSRWSGETYAQRALQQADQLAAGGLEPSYTCFTPLFRLTLGPFPIIPSLYESADGKITSFSCHVPLARLSNKSWA